MGRRLPEKLVGHGNGGHEIVFRRVRELEANEALYVADRPLQGSAVVVFKERGSRQYAIDLGNGFTQAIDLRPDPDAPSQSTRTPGTPPRLARDKAPQGLPADDRLSPHRPPTLSPHEVR
jgi:hypothetical protein